MFSLIPGLPSPTSACSCLLLFGWFIGTTPESDPSAACISVVRPLAFPDRPVTASGATEVSRFSGIKFLSVREVYDYAGPVDDSQYRRRRCCLGPKPKFSKVAKSISRPSLDLIFTPERGRLLQRHPSDPCVFASTLVPTFPRSAHSMAQTKCRRHFLLPV
jgi:hypothetical protein